MGRVINIDSPGKQRSQFMRGVALAVRELEDIPENSTRTRDLVAFILLSIDAINKTVDISVQAWEKRGYWLKADRFRTEWSWAYNTGIALRRAITAGDWQSITSTLEIVRQNVSNVKVASRHQLGKPWVGAWEKLTKLQ